MAVTYEHILEAFPPGPPWVEPIPGTPPEIILIERDFRGKSWPEITTQICNYHSDAYNMLAPEPLAYFLPAFLRAAVADPKGTAAVFLVYFVCSSRSHDRALRLLTDEHRDVLFGVVGWLLQNDDGYFASGERQQYVARLREWKESAF